MSGLEALVELARQLWVVWMMLAFIAIAFWAFRPSNKKRFERDAQIPLRDDHPESPKK
jgi:cytochrome c oxidase cbb3-type subunit 4